MNDSPDEGAHSQRPVIRAGQVVGGRYRVLGLLGRGGMGIVYSALHELTQRRVALKVVDSDGRDVTALRDRFLSEARTAAAVRHPNIVDILDMGMHGGAPYLVMELLEGRSLDVVLQESHCLNLAEALNWLFPIMGALSTLHAAGIIHRDIKPSNIFLNQVGHAIVPKLLDFGLARAASDERITRSGVVIGTPMYMAPEHAAGQPVGPAADVWSMGVVLFECLTGSLPFSARDRSAQAAQLLAGHVRPLRQLRPDLPARVAEAIDRALQRELGQRHSSMKAFARALLQAAVLHGLDVPEQPDPTGLSEYPQWRQSTLLRALDAPEQETQELAAEAAPALSDDPPRAPAPARRHPALLLALGLGLLLILLWLWPRDASAPAAPARVDASVPSAAAEDDAPELQPDVVPLDASAAPDEQPEPSTPAAPASPPRERPRNERARRVVKPTKAPAPASEVETEWK